MSSATMTGLPDVDPRAGAPIFGEIMLYIL
jgi:hypothetical protein